MCRFRVLLSLIALLAFATPGKATAPTFNREVGLLLTNIPERPVQTIHIRIDVPKYYEFVAASFQDVPTLQGLTDDDELVADVQEIPGGGTKVSLDGTFATPRKLRGYLLRFTLRMPNESAVPFPLRFRLFKLVLDNGRVSRAAKANIYIASGPGGVGDLP